MTQKERIASRMTVQRGLEERRMAAKVAMYNAELEDAAQRRREKVQKQMAPDYLFDTINRDNCKLESTKRLRGAIEVQAVPVQEKPGILERICRGEWREFFLLTAGTIVWIQLVL